MKKLFALILILVIVFSACEINSPTNEHHETTTSQSTTSQSTTSQSTTTPTDNRRIIINSYTLEVDEVKQFSVKFVNMEEEPVTYSYDNQNIWIYDNKIQGMLSGTTTIVTATTDSGVSTVFNVTVREDNYSSTLSQEISEGWLNPIEVNPLNNKIDSSFPLGIDMSMVYQVVQNGGKYYNSEGKRQNVFQILADNGVNYVRLRLWNDPYNTYSTGEKVSYGGGTCDKETIIKLAREAKAVGLKLLLDFHYSDFWADPTYQVIPKAWADYKTSDEVANALYEYTKSILLELKEVDALPDIVQIGNEVTHGMMTKYPGDESDKLTGDLNAEYLTNSYSLNSNIRGYAYTDNFRKYLKAGLDAVNEVDGDILTMIHISKGMTGTDFMKSFYQDLNGLDFDIIGLSYYPKYQGKISDLKNALDFLYREFPDKLVTIAETSYAFTYASSIHASNSFNSEWTLSGYDVSVSGQANFLRDVIETLASSPNGYGLFWWEGAWLPVAGAGWADSLTRCTWANQTFFTYNGKVLPSLSVFNAVKD